MREHRPHVHTARVHRSPTALAIALAVLSPAALASAQAGRIGFLRASDPTQVAIAREDVDVRCRATDETELTCSIIARWELRNDGDDARTPQLMITWGGDPTSAEVRVGEAVIATEIPELRPLLVIVPPHATTIVEMRTEQPITTYGGTGPGSEIASPIDPHDALAARHPLVATRWEIARRGLVWVGPSIVHFTSLGPTTIRVHPIEGWEASAHAEHAISDRTEDGARTFVWTPSEHDENVRAVIGLELSHGVHTDVLRNGGPFIAFGATFNEGYEAFRGRLGYEIGLGEWVLFSASVETDFERQVVVAPLLEVATWSNIIAPSLSIGLGVPIQVLPYAQAGVRIEAAATFYSIAFVAAVDFWPAHSDDDSVWQLHLLGRIGL